MKIIFLALSMILGLSACGGSDNRVSKENRGFYILETQSSALNNMSFRGSSRNNETCELFKSENNFFSYELTGINVHASGKVTGIVGIRNQIL
jgi:hypothetical protein